MLLLHEEEGGQGCKTSGEIWEDRCNNQLEVWLKEYYSPHRLSQSKLEEIVEGLIDCWRINWYWEFMVNRDGYLWRKEYWDDLNLKIKFL